MGIESAVYWFVPGSGDSAVARNTLVALGAQVVDEQHMVLRGAEHWIDVQLDVPPPTVALRLALSNPPHALRLLRDTLSALKGADPGEVVDVAARERYDAFDDAAWSSIVASFERRKREFQSHFGEFTAAISADDVFDHVHRARADE